MKNIVKQITLSLKNPIIHNHVVYGQEVLPGLAYIDMIYQLFREHGYSYADLQLRNLSIYTPLSVGKNATTILTISCVEKKAGRWNVTVEGHEQRSGQPASNKKIYMKTEMHTGTPVVFAETLELDQLKQSLLRTVDLNTMYDQCRSQELVHIGFMKVEGQIYETETGIVMDLSVGEEALPTAEHFMFHPTLIDGSGVGSNLMVASLVKGEERLYLPLFYESFSATELLQTKCITRIQTSSVRMEKELIYLTMEFFNSAGKKVAELKNFTSKLVRGAELINPERKQTAQSAEEPEAVQSAEGQQLAEPAAATLDSTQAASSTAPASNANTTNTGSYDTIIDFLQQLMAERLNKPKDQIETEVGYYQMGLDSPGLLDVVEAIGDKIDESLSPTLLFEYTTVAELAEYLEENYASSFGGSAQAGQEDGEAVTPAHSTFASATSSMTAATTTAEPAISQGTATHKPSTTAATPYQNVVGDIAIIGMAGRYPQAGNIHEFWQNLKDGKDCISEVPASRWDWRSLEGITSPSGKSISKWGGFIDDPDCFDPQFFRISPREAETMDPQERLFLEACWESIEDAGYTPKTLVEAKGKSKRQNVGVFVGVMHKDYSLIGAEAIAKGDVFPLSLNYAQIANRVSYFCNFHGPSMAVDTVCSSSLTAVHLALESIRHGECEVALAGGVNLSLHPNKYMTYGIWDMFSSDGYCHTFGQGGDGYVSGEGIGAVLLKPLDKAVQDGDRIYAVIKASTVNHVGTVSGISVPSPVAQADLIEACLDKAGIDARTMSYIEAHGTGTSLGDPIEIQGLVKAFRQHTQDKQFCSIGSVKSNIGHAESAAGISGLTKVALQLHHKTLVPSLHSLELNPYLDLPKSPFYIQHVTEEWKQPVIIENGQAITYPRRAGVSSFGATGSNAHIVLEEYIPEKAHNDKPVQLMTDAPAIIPLSAKSPDRLQAYAKKLHDFLHDGINLADLAYTLQVGREAMEERVVFLATSIRELKEKVAAFAEGNEAATPRWIGQDSNQEKTNSHSKSSSQDNPADLHTWIKEGNATKIAERWVKGLAMDWKLLYGDAKPARISLPTYPFEKVRYWLPLTDRSQDNGKPSAAAVSAIHPLLHQNISDISGLQFRSVFTGEEFFLADHVVQGQRMLPGAAYLEMVRAAVEKAVADQTEARIELKNIVWIRPFAVADQKTPLHIRLYPEDDGEIAYEIFSESHDEVDAEDVVYGQGSAVLYPVEEAPVLDIGTLKESCNIREFSSIECYAAYQQMGIEYGPGHKGVENIYVGNQQLLTKLSLPTAIADTIDQYVLHPGLIDSALQASVGLRLSADDLSKPMLPFAMESVEIFGKCTSSMWVYTRYSEGSTPHDLIQKLDIDLCDDQGKVGVRLKGFASRALEGEAAVAGDSATIGTLLLEPVWTERAVTQGQPAVDFTARKAILCDFSEITSGQLKAELDCITFHNRQDSIQERFEAYAVQVFAEIQKILLSKPKGNVLIQVVVSSQRGQHLLSALSGLLKTAQMENPKLTGQLIEAEPGIHAEDIARLLEENSRGRIDKHVRYQEGQRLVAGWNDIEIAQAGAEGKADAQAGVPWKDKGVYLITGGAGGLGLIFAQEIASQVKDAVLILTGRSPLNNEKESQLRDLQNAGARVIYKQVDVTQKAAVHQLIQDIQAEYGSLNGIIHSAGVIKDNFILKKTSEEIREVLAPKVTGLAYLDEITKELPLDFFILFSSGASAVGNLGQADYAMANAFMNVYAEYRNTLTASGQRHGKTLSMIWPLWKEGGMHVDAESEKFMKKTTGMVAMRTETGIRALYQGLAYGKSQVLVVEGDVQQVRNLLELEPSDTATATDTAALPSHDPQAASGVAQDVLKEKTEQYLKGVLSHITKLPADRIDAGAPMEKYGIDSLMIMQMTNELEREFGSLSKTLFFEYQDIRSLAGYFIENYHSQLIGLLGIKEEATPADEQTSTSAANTGAGSNDPRVQSQTQAQSQKTPTQVQIHTKANRRRKSSGYVPVQKLAPKAKETPKTDTDIAIIGISGRYPQADTIHEFWKNLREGKDCVTEIPKDRWDHSLYYDEDKDKPGKTYSKWGGFINDVDKFDPRFFNISPREAELIDPQERLFLQCVYETLEDAGYTRENIGAPSGFDVGANVGVYVGVMYEEYQLYGAQEQALGRPIALTGNPSSIANRVSYYFNFHGPSIAMDTMCSSSLTALHLACQSLQHGECEVAVAGGVNVSIHPNKYLMLGQGKFVSSKGRCESFGIGGEGYVPGEGVGAILLKPLAKAIADGDNIYGVVKGTAINHGGKTNGYSVPNPNAQADVIRRALKEAGIDPRAVSYIEAHGTGTSLGDPIEIAGLTKAFSEHTKDKQFCAIGSAKSNIGHCESAAGIAAITKVLLQLKHRQIVPSLHSQVLNPNIDFINTPFVVQQELAEWKRPELEINGVTKEVPRIAGISSFGAGGVNAHVLIEEYIPSAETAGAGISPTAPSRQNPVMIVLSAKNEEKLQQRAQRLLAAIREYHYTDADLVRIAYTLQVGREAMDERLAVLAGSISDLEEKLSRFTEGQAYIQDLYRGQVKRNKDTLDVFAADEDMAQTIEAWIQKGKYGKLMDLWVKGLHLDWNKLYGDTKPRRISLPAYPFAKERYWIGENSLKKAGGRTTGETGGSLQPVMATSVDTLKPVAAAQSAGGIQPVTPVRSSGSTRSADQARPVSSVMPGAVQQPSTPARAIVNTQPIATEFTASHVKAKPTDVALKPLLDGQTQHVIPTTSSTTTSHSTVSIEALHEELTASLADVLFMNQADVDVDAKFIDLGMDSITGLEWIKAVNKHYGTNIMVTKVYDYPTIRDFAGFLKNELAKQGNQSLPEIPATPVTPVQAAQVLNKPTNILLQPLTLVSENATQSATPVVVVQQQQLTQQPSIQQQPVQQPTPAASAPAQPSVSVEALHEELTESLAEVLFMNQSEVDLDEKFIDLGMDSITGLEWIKAINKRYGTNIMVTKVYDYPTIRDFAGFLKNELGKLGTHTLAAASALQPVHTAQDELTPIPAATATTAATTMSQPAVSVEALHEELAASLAEVLYMEHSDMDLDEKFIDLGMDSITGLEWIKAINKRYGTSIVVTKVYDYPTIRDFAGFLQKELGTTVTLPTQEPAPEPASAHVLQPVTVTPTAQPKPAMENVQAEQPVAKETRATESVGIKPVVTAPKEAAAPTVATPAPKPSDATIPTSPDAIAIVGMSGRYPGAGDLTEYWDNLIHARNSVREIPTSRWDVNQYYDPKLSQKGKIYCKSIGALDEIEYFDPLFFNIPPSEAELIDPQHRIFLQESYKAFEDAGYSPQSLSNQKCGVYLGIMNNDYGTLLLQNQLGGSATGNTYSIAAARISYYLNLKGPAISIDTACSSSLVGTHLACQALKTGEIDMALVGGVTLYLTPESYISMCGAGMLSPDGQCKTFDNSANGFVPGEGAGALVLKRLKDAEADGDHIYGVIIGTGINQDGKTNGITAPSAKSQMELERDIYDRYHIHPESISYVEMHGTGTKQGDPIELDAISTVFQERTDQKNFCAIGSVKSNIGHTSAAAGVASMQKVLLCMQHEKLVPTLNFTNPNEHFDFENSPFYVNTEYKQWETAKGAPRRAGVSSFGYSGTNAHLVIEEYLPGKNRPQQTESTEPVLFVLSAKRKEQLKTYAQGMKRFIQSQAQWSLTDLAYTLQVGREAMDHRMAFVADSKETLLQSLDAFLADKTTAGIFTAQVKQSKGEVKVFETDEDAKSLLETWIEKKKLSKLAELWVKGLRMDWNKLYGGEVRPRRISLPAYPFAKEYYWIPENPDKPEAENGLAPKTTTATVPTTTVAEGTNDSAETRPTVFLKKQWEPSPIVSTKKGSRTIAILANKETASLAVELSAHLFDCQILQINNIGSQLSEYDWTSFDGFIDLIGCGSSTDEQMNWMMWLQKLIEHGHREGLTVMCVTKGLESFQNSSMNLSGAAYVGLYRMLQTEYSHLKSRHMDVEALLDDQAIARLIAEELYAEGTDIEVCYRDGIRYRAHLAEWSISEDTTEQMPQAFPEGHVLLVTGGTRGLGYLCAQHFVKHYGVRRLVLTGREALPPRDQWTALQQSGTSVGKKIESILELEALGAQVQVLSLPLSDAAAVQEALQDIKTSMGPIGGVIHCAGMGDIKNPAFMRKAVADIQKVLEPKVAGLQTLYHALRDEPLQFFVLFSSVSGTIPVLAKGQSDYAMANAYMDYFAEAHKNDSPIVSIVWPNWKETGMGEVKGKAYGLTGLQAMTNAEGLQLLDQILSQKINAVILPAVINPDRWNPRRLMQRVIEDNPSAGTPLRNDAETVTARSESVKAEVVRVEPAKPEPVSAPVSGSVSASPSSSAPISQEFADLTHEWLLGLFSKELKISRDNLEIDERFEEYGIDSIVLTQLLQQINQQIAGNIDPSIIFEYPTIESFAEWLMDAYAHELMKVLGISSKKPEQPPVVAPSTDQAPDASPAPTDSPIPTVSSVIQSEVANQFTASAQEIIQPQQPAQVQVTVTPPSTTTRTEDIAIIGLSCHFPGAESLEQYWSLIAEGRSAIGPVPQERWGYANSYYAGLIDGMSHFDSEFFRLPDEDVQAMDPQALAVLEQSLKLWYHAGYTHQEIKGKPIGVYLGGRSQHKPGEASLQQARNPVVALGQNYLAANISHFFDLRGPSLVLDTACSSALVGLNMAIQALRSGDIEAAVVGGVSLLNTDDAHQMFSQRGLLCADPAFHVFDQRAGGVVLGEGVGMVLVKTLSQALQDGDSIYAVIKATAVNNDGKTAGPATPNLQAQKDVMQAALAKSGKKASDISYIEANGSGSTVTDLLELKAIQSVYRSFGEAPIGLGSVKPNIGHPLCAEGIASLIKVVLMLKNRQLAPFLSGEQGMEHFDMEAANFRMYRESTEWMGATPVAGINCFGDGGTNVHVIIEAWEETSPRTVTRHPLPQPELKRKPLKQDSQPQLQGASKGMFWKTFA
ncbi:SDR family NAD(P)-dependent oxidoreductase [Brevibacillus dissolubilis]|uniref:SDR family NAD(P)-dependent oxidoreductase n=1 Tax=Brevibacillus dissolubilis TaxID=1844116 RepID=UPI0026F21215|nr:SDR family NAD(P)-dependent oxidoreductase [Brevibacillus dissolubilis]